VTGYYYIIQYIPSQATLSLTHTHALYVYTHQCRYGFGFGALERSYYDGRNKIFYGGSERGFVTVSDFANYPDTVVVTDAGFPLTNSLTDIKVCGDWLFVSTKDDPNPGMLHIYQAAMRMTNDADTNNNNTSSSNITAPVLLHSVPVGVGPDNILVSSDCLLVATADEGEGDYSDDTGLINPVGTVTIVRGPFDDPATLPNATTVSLNVWTETELLQKGVHLTLSLNASMYWNATLPGADFTNVIDSYTPDMNLEPEYLAFGAGETTIYANLQENNAVVVIDVETNTATDIFT
jgi:hypothetical protein